MTTAITAIEDRLMTIAEIHWINRRENPAYTGSTVLPSVAIDYAYNITGEIPGRARIDAISVTLTTAATDHAIGSSDIDAHNALADQIIAKLNGWNDQSAPTSALKWRVTRGANANRDTGYCESTLVFERAETLNECEA